jgi:AraC family transcriptional regulator of arabinose operon
MYTLSGEGYARINGEEKHLKPGDLALIKNDTPHAYGTRKGQTWNFVWAHFVPDTQIIQWLQLPETLKGFVSIPIDNANMQKRIYRAFKRIIFDSRQGNSHSNELCMNALNEVMLLVSQNLKKPFDPRVAEVIHWLTEQLAEPLQIDELARRVGLSASRTSHLFKAETGHSIVETLIQIRLRQAALLLRHSNRSAIEIAMDVGFRNYNHFANQFKIYYDVTPTTYRKDTQNR